MYMNHLYLFIRIRYLNAHLVKIFNRNNFNGYNSKIHKRPFLKKFQLLKLHYDVFLPKPDDTRI